ncbi:MAG: hypothetical protein KDJ67_17695 [Nitratireductor sp.]|nr:hypothetical protein [Nitratireductor sp.]
MRIAAISTSIRQTGATAWKIISGRGVKPVAAMVIASVALISAIAPASAAGDDPFDVIRGKWRGSGTMSFTDGTKQRIACSAQYTGTASQLGLVIACKSSISEITLSARLSANGGNLLGTWEEKTYKAIGSVSGRATESRIRFYIGGYVLGTMTVNYNKSRQQVVIATKGIPLKDLTIAMKRQ